MINKHKFAEFFATIFYLGKIKYCPGTFGSLVAFPLCYFITNYLNNNFDYSSKESHFIFIFSTLMTICLILFIFGAIVSHLYAKSINITDPKEVIIDEVVGQMLSLICCFFSVIFLRHSNVAKYFSDNVIDVIFLFILPLALFRFFDIIKPWPINWFDKNIKGGLGIMLDDIVAAIFAIILHYGIVFILIDLVN